MDNLIGYPLKEVIDIIEKTEKKIINIKKVTGSNKKFNNLDNPYVIRVSNKENYISLFVTYY